MKTTFNMEYDTLFETFEVYLLVYYDGPTNFDYEVIGGDVPDQYIDRPEFHGQMQAKIYTELEWITAK